MPFTGQYYTTKCVDVSILPDGQQIEMKGHNELSGATSTGFWVRGRGNAIRPFHETICRSHTLLALAYPITPDDLDRCLLKL